LVIGRQDGLGSGFVKTKGFSSCINIQLILFTYIVLMRSNGTCPTPLVGCIACSGCGDVSTLIYGSDEYMWYGAMMEMVVVANGGWAFGEMVRE
jgi:hypothetical protein